MATTNSTATSSSAGDVVRRVPPLDRLWRIGDVADYLTLCENSANAVTKTASAPPPIVERGNVRLWHHAQWDRWARALAGIDLTTSAISDAEIEWESPHA